MGLWNSIVSGIKDNIKNRKAASSQEYQNAFSQANESIGRTQNLADQYTGNRGYANSLEQAQQGAGKLANAVVGQSTNAARGAGMSKAQAAQMGMQNANQAYANAFTGQQSNAMGLGQNAVTAQQGITSAQQGQAGQAASEKQAVFNRATENSPERQIANVAGVVAGL